jgi:hypothetical protein
MPSIENIKGSDGTNETVRAIVTAQRAVSSTTIQVNSIVGFNTSIIGSTGALDADNRLTVRPQVFFGHLSGSDIEIDSFAPGYTDQGNEVGDVVLIKPTTAWADEIAALFAVSHDDDGTLNAAALAQTVDATKTEATTNGLRTKTRISTAASGNISPNIDDYNYYRRTAQAASITIANPTGTPVDGDGLLIELQDNGTTRAITWGSGYAVDSIYGLALPTTTVVGKTHFITFIRNATTSKWVAVL